MARSGCGQLLLLFTFAPAFLVPAYADLQGSAAGGLDGRSLDLRLRPEDVKRMNMAARPDFSGLWVLDRSHSDDLKEVLEAARAGAARAAPGGGNRGGLGRRADRGGAEGSGFRSEGRRMGRDAGDELERIPGLFQDQFEILHQEPEMTITSARQGARKIYTDYRGSSVSAMGNRDQRVTTCGWEGNLLIIETTAGGGRQTIQRLRLLADPRRLELVTELPMRGRQGESVKVRQVFLSKG